MNKKKKNQLCFFFFSRLGCIVYNNCTNYLRSSKSGIDEPVGEGGKGTTAGIQGGELAEGLHDAEGDDANDTKADDEGGGPAGGEGAAGADEEARADDAGEGHHGQVTGLEAALDAALGVNVAQVAITAARRLAIVVSLLMVVKVAGVAVDGVVVDEGWVVLVTAAHGVGRPGVYSTSIR